MAGEPEDTAAAVQHFHTHSIPLDMEDIERDWDTPVTDAGIAAKASVIVRVGMLDLGAGTGSFRVREMMHRIAYPLGVHVRADVNLTDIEAACTDGKDRITEVVDLPTTGVNTERIWLLEHFADWFNVNLGEESIYHAKPTVSEELVEQLDNPASRKSAMRAVKQARREPPKGQYAQHFDHVGAAAVTGGNGITVRQAHDRLDLIERRPPLYSPWFSGLASALACAAFVFLLGGGPYDMVGAFIGAGLGQFLRRLLFAHRLNQFFVTFVCVALAALACTGTLRMIGLFDPVALQHDTAYIGAMLFVIPGFPLITGGLDIAKIDFPSGIQRITYTFAIILMATLAGWMVATIVHLNPQGFEPLGLSPLVNGLFRLVAAFVGVWGFSVLFNSPQRMCLTAASIGAITDTLRLTIVDFGVPPEAAAFIGALLSGLLASAWRSSVRRGWLPPHLGYPRICLTVPSIVIMVPGLYMYQAMFQLGQFDTQSALDWAFRAFMVILCLPVGLAMARVITDKSWRYDI
ncbi:threonine/serine exporter family protein [Bifidobacterium subtile]|nr:threonine/serine exporter family protein [Bifidobacterium subtile]MCI1223702.1 threonine/serine exporter family protein [Bifidobacterium subtile]MCI1242148.1 threonine/serine exporter family protein [Bifidobacterium subtile]QOL37715.1 threonine/serine exporter family protein [Bifidobacterium subtile]